MKGLFSILAVASRQWRWITGGIVAGIIVIAANALLMAVAGWFIASMAVAGARGTVFDFFMPSAGIRALAIIRTAGRYVERLVTHEAAFRILADLRVWLFKKLEPLAPAGLERYAGGEVSGRLRADVDALESLYLRIIAPIAVGGISILLAVVFMAFWSGTSALALLIFLLAAGVALPLYVRKRAAEPGQRATALAGELRTAITEGLQGAEELILLGAVKRQAEAVNDLSAQLVAEQKRLGGINGLAMAGSITCGGLGVATVLMTGSLAVTTGALTGPALVMLLLFAAAAFEAAGGLPGAMQQIPAAKEAARRIRQLADAPPPVPDPAHSTGAVPLTTAIVFCNVTCSHASGSTALHNFNLEIPAGGHVALTGPSGSGKSTVAGILLRFRGYSGSITIGGIEIRDLAGEDLRCLITAVPQHPHLFNSSIRENILLGQPEATGEQLELALEDAGLKRWVAGLPLGLDTPVGENGSAVSGGEARRIALARALLKNAPILLLDEPTEGLDAVTEQEVVARLKERARGKTMLLISHRPACLALAEQVVQLTKGQQP